MILAGQLHIMEASDFARGYVESHWRRHSGFILWHRGCDEPCIWVNSVPDVMSSKLKRFRFISRSTVNFLQNHAAPLFHTRYTITIFLNCPGLLFKTIWL
jgi:hypothetical protein